MVQFISEHAAGYDYGRNCGLARASHPKLAGLSHKEPFPIIKVEDESEEQGGITVRHDWKSKTSPDAQYF